MAPDTAFEYASTLAMLGWSLLAAGVVCKPGVVRHGLLQFGGRFVPLLLCATYVLLLAQHWGSAPGGNFGSLAGVATLFASPGKLVGGWVHFLAFDLWLGRWMVDDVQAQQRSRWFLLPCLPLTFLFGPAGLLLYFALKARPRMLRIQYAYFTYFSGASSVFYQPSLKQGGQVHAWRCGGVALTSLAA